MSGKSFKDKILGAFMNEAEEEQVDPNKPLGKQITENTGSFTVMKPVGNSGQGNTYAVPTTNYTPETIHHVLTEEEKQKFSAKVNEIYNSVNDPKPSFHEFIDMKKTLEGALPDAQLYPKVFQGMKKQGLTYTVLVSTAENTVKVLQKNLDEYNTAVKETLDHEVGSKRQLIEQKKNELVQAETDYQKQLEALQAAYNQKVTKLNEDIGNLSVDVTTAEQRIKKNSVAYNTFMTGAIQDVQKSVDDIKTYIPVE